MRIERHKLYTEKQKAKLLLPLEKELKEQLARMAVLEEARQLRIPFYEKIDQSSQKREFDHFQNLKKAEAMKNAVAQSILKSRANLN